MHICVCVYIYKTESLCWTLETKRRLQTNYRLVFRLVLGAQSRPTLCSPTDWSLPGSSVRGILEARISQWVAISFSRGSSQHTDWTEVSCIASGFFTDWATRETNHISIFKRRFHVMYQGLDTYSLSSPLKPHKTSPQVSPLYRWENGGTELEWSVCLQCLIQSPYSAEPSELRAQARVPSQWQYHGWSSKLPPGQSASGVKARAQNRCQAGFHGMQRSQTCPPNGSILGEKLAQRICSLPLGSQALQKGSPLDEGHAAGRPGLMTGPYIHSHHQGCQGRVFQAVVSLQRQRLGPAPLEDTAEPHMNGKLTLTDVDLEPQAKSSKTRKPP